MDTAAIDRPALPELDARKRFGLLEDCRDRVLDDVGRSLDGALARVVEELVDEATTVTSRDRQQTLLDAVALVRRQGRAIVERFRHALGDEFERRLAGTAAEPVAPHESSDASSDEMRLVADETLSQDLDTGRLVHRARSRLDPLEVLGIRARLAALLEREWFDEADHPLAPEAIFEALRRALAPLSPDPSVRNTLLNAFEPHLSANLNATYAGVNARLKAEQVLPRIRAHVGHPQVGHPQGSHAQGCHAQPGHAPVGNGTADAPPSAGGPAKTPSAAAFSAARAQLERLLADIPAAPARARGHAARVLSDPGMFGVADLPIDRVSPPVLASLSEVQHEDARMLAELLPVLIERVREHGSSLDRMTVELVSVVFEQVQSDRTLADSVRQQILRLPVIAVKAALLDRSFFARRAHPLRRLIDRMTRLAVDPDVDLDEASPLIATLRGVIDRLVASFDQDLAAFTEAIDAIEHACGEARERRSAEIAQRIEAATCEEARALATEDARRTIEARLDATVAGFVRAFLLDCWAPVVALGFHDALATADLVAWSVAPKTPDEVRRLASLLPRMLRSLVEGARLADVPPAQREAFMLRLMQTHTAIIAMAKARTPAPGHAPDLAPDLATEIAIGRAVEPAVADHAPGHPALPGSDPDPDPASRAAGGPSAKHSGVRPATVLARFRKGDRVRIVAGDGGSSIFRLAWVSPARKLYILSRHPAETRTFDSASLAALVLAGNASIVADPLAVDVALDRSLAACES